MIVRHLLPYGIPDVTHRSYVRMGANLVLVPALIMLGRCRALWGEHEQALIHENSSHISLNEQLIRQRQANTWVRQPMNTWNSNRVNIG